MKKKICKKKKAYIVSAVVLKGGAGKSFVIYMLLEFLREKFYLLNSKASKFIDKMLVCDLDVQVSLLARIKKFKQDRRTVFFLDQDSLGEKIKIKYQAPDEHDLYKFDLILLDNSPECRYLFTEKNMINNTDLFLIPVNTLSCFIKVEDTINSIRKVESKEKISKILIVFNDTMYIAKKASDAIVSMCKQLSSKYENVFFWGFIKHSRKVSMAEITGKPIYKYLHNTACGKDNKRLSKEIINLAIDNRKGCLDE